jgi:hypothetical protein
MNTDVVGRVLRASTRGFCCGIHSARIDDRHDFGAFVKAPVANHQVDQVIGLIYAVEVKDDLMISELVMAETVNPNVLRDQRENRLVPVEVSVLNIGYHNGSHFVHSLPPRPPMSLSAVTVCTAEEVRAFTVRPDFFRLVLQASEVPSDDLLATSLRHAMWAYPEEERRDFMVASGRHLARLLSNDLKRLSHILTLIRP